MAHLLLQRLGIHRHALAPLLNDAADDARAAARDREVTVTIEGDHVVLTDALELTDLDFSEFEASVDSLSLALASHLNALTPFGEK